MAPSDESGPDGFWQRIYAFLFRFLGPAQVDPAPAERPPSDADYACPACGRPMGEHEHTPGGGRPPAARPAPPAGRPGGPAGWRIACLMASSKAARPSKKTYEAELY